MEAHRFTNRLIHETSPYLQQHAHNPVDWVPWGNEAFDTAKRENRPILLSIGYSACHWCHVMEAESFEDEAIARIMNENFVNIKVDREERPDLDQIYQNAVQLFIRRGGGWPLTMFLTPDKVPFYGGTYFPPEDRYRLPGFPKILQIVAQTYREKPGDIAKTVHDVKEALRQMSDSRTGQAKRPISPHLLEDAAESLGRIFDTRNGGFGGAPKFPSTPALTLLLRHYQQSGDENDLKMATFTLNKMARGGIYDQLGGGFHRYATDDHWLVPHFEKMLYDNAQLARLYFQAYQATGRDFYRAIGEEILAYVLREMTDPLGGFYATQDADSEGDEGKYFVWTPEEIRNVIGEGAEDLLCRYYNATPSGNFEGKNILHITQSIASLSKETGTSPESLEQTIKGARQKLLQEREKRVKPFRDEKILTSWNGLMIGAFVEGYLVSRNERYLSTAKKGAEFILTSLCKEGRLLRTFKNGRGKLNAYLEDYVFFIDALLDLYEATFEPGYLDHAKQFTAQLIDQFWDNTEGGFFFTPNDHESLIARHKPSTDQSIPSGNAVAARILLRLFYLTGEKDYFEKGEKTLQSFSNVMEEDVFSTGNMIAAADFYLRRPKEILVVGD
ncbi:MAG: thioredoxin domain-containing protein, partial [Nitrospiria bacterium]